MKLWTYAVAAGFVTAALVDALKLVLPRGLAGPSSKVYLGFVLSVCLSIPFLYWGALEQLGVVWGLSWGISRLVHSLTSSLQAVKDRQRLDVRRFAQRR